MSEEQQQYISRYSLTPRIDFGGQFGTSSSIAKIRKAVELGLIQTKETFSKEAVRLDNIAGQVYGDGRYFWLIAAASNIGWCLQVPPNTRILIPNLEQSLQYLG